MGRNWSQAGAHHLVDPVNTELAANVFSGTPAASPQYLAVGVVEWAASAVVATQDSADGLVGGNTAPSYGIQLGWMSGGTFVAVNATNPLPVTGGGGGGGTQYINGTAVSSGSLETMVASGYDGTNVRALLASNTGQLHVIVDSGGGGGSQYVEGVTTSPATGTVALGRVSSSGVLQALEFDSSGNLKVNVVVGGGSSNVTVVGPLDGSGNVKVAQQGTVTVSGTVAATQSGSWTVAVSNFPATQPVSGTVAVSNFPATQAVTQSTSPWVVSGTVTANAGTGTFTTQDAADQTIGAAVGTLAQMVGVKDNSGNVAFLSLDSSGNLKVTGSGGGTTNITQWDSVALGAPTAFGVAPSGNVIGVNADLFVNGAQVTPSAPAPFLPYNVSGVQISDLAAIAQTVTAGSTYTSTASAGHTVISGGGVPAYGSINFYVSSSQSGTFTVYTGSGFGNNNVARAFTIVGGTDFEISIAANSQAVYWDFHNTSGSSATLNVSAFGNQGIAAPKALTNSGNFRTAIQEWNAGVIHVISDSGSTTTVTGTVAATQSGSWTVGVNNFPSTYPVTGTFWQATQPVSVASAVTVAQATAANLNATVVFPSAQHVIVDSGAVSVTGTVTTTPPSHASTNVDQFGGSGVVTGTGVSGAGIPRVTVSNDSAIKVWDGTNVASVKTLTNSNPLCVEIVDGSGNQITSFGGGVQFADNAASGATPTGTLSMGWDSTNSKVRALKVDASQNLVVSGTVVSRIGGNTGATLDSTVGAGTAPTNMVAVGGIYNNTQPAPTDGQSLALQLDQAGNLREFSGVALKTLSTQGTALNSTQTIFSNSGCQSVLIQLTQTSTITAGAVTFEFTYDGSTWAVVPAQFVIDPTIFSSSPNLPYTCQASTNKLFLILCNGAQGLRIRTSTAITGTGAVTPNYALLNFCPYISVTIPGNVSALSTQAGQWNVRMQDSTGNALTSTGSALDVNLKSTSVKGSSTSANSIPVVIASDQGAVPVSGTFFQATQPISAASLPLPSGASTSAKQPALGTAGSASADVITIQGVASMTAVKVDGSAVTQPVSGTVTVNALPSGSNTIGSVKVTDGTNTAKVLAASTAPAAGDTALEVGINPLSQPVAIGVIMDSTGVQRTISIARFDTSSSGTAVLVAASGSTKVYVLSYKVSANGTTNVNLQSHTTTSNTSGIDFFVANQGAVYDHNPGTWLTGTASEGIDINNSAAIHIAGYITYCQF